MPTLSEWGSGDDAEKENAVHRASFPLHKDAGLDVSGGRRVSNIDYRSVAKVLQKKVAGMNLRASEKGQGKQEGEQARRAEGVVDFEAEVQDFLLAKMRERQASRRSRTPSPLRKESRTRSKSLSPRALRQEVGAMSPLDYEGAGSSHSRPSRAVAEEGQVATQKEKRINLGINSEENLGKTVGVKGKIAAEVANCAFSAGDNKAAGTAQDSTDGRVEAKLRELDKLPLEMANLRQEMASLKKDNQTLSQEFADFMGHTTTLLTKLQSQFQQLLNSERGQTSKGPTSSFIDPRPVFRPPHTIINPSGDPDQLEARPASSAPVPSQYRPMPEATSHCPGEQSSPRLSANETRHLQRVGEDGSNPDEAAKLPSFAELRSSRAAKEGCKMFSTETRTLGWRDREPPTLPSRPLGSMQTQLLDNSEIVREPGESWGKRSFTDAEEVDYMSGRSVR